MKRIKYSILFLVAVIISLSKGYNQQERVTLPVRCSNIQSQDVVRQKSTNWSGYKAGRFIIKPDDEGQMDFDTALANNLQQIIIDIRDKTNVPGISTAMLIPGKGLWAGVCGYSTLEPLDSVCPDMLFHLASSTKSYISAIMLQLTEEGELSLDDSIGTYLTDLPTNISGQITIRQLLNMTSGLWDYLTSGNMAGTDSLEANLDRYWTFDDIINILVGPPVKQPGISFFYSNTNLVLAGMIIREVTQSSISDQLHQRIFEPLNLEHSFYVTEDTLVGPIAHPWSGDKDNWNIAASNAAFSLVTTAGGIFSTAEDLARWGYALFSGQILTPESIEQLQTMVPCSRWDGYGLCVFRLPILGKRLWGHEGAIIYGYNSCFFYYPPSGISIAVLTNDANYDTMSNILISLFNEFLKIIPVSSAAQSGALYVLSYLKGYGVYLAEAPSIVMDTVGQAMYNGLRKFKAHPVTGDLWGIAAPPFVGQHLVKFDGVTGEAFPRAKISLPGSYTLTGMDFSSDGTLYAASSKGDIFSVDTASGIGTLIISSPVKITALAIQPESGEFWASEDRGSEDRIYRINIQNGDTVGVGNTGFNQNLKDIAFDSEGKLFGALDKTGMYLTGLVYIDTETGKGIKMKSYDEARIYSIAFTSGAVMSSLPKSDIDEPGWFELNQNYPNPFNSSTVISYQLSSTEDVELSVYDLLGQKVATLVKERQQPGSYEATWDATEFPDGIYFYRLEAGSYVESKRMVLIK